mmetsp:Transcript_83113/g.209508  ORF Transcript_83113/g.209508 Transcript_83113/m.209508 type:complete len:378 (+) Transcript_83113:459-1592(+)
MPMEGEPDCDWLAGRLQPQPCSHVAAPQLAEGAAIVALAAEDFRLDLALRKGRAEGLQDVLLVLLGAPGCPDTSGAVENHARGPSLRVGWAAPRPVLLQRGEGHLLGSGAVLRPSDHGERRGHSVVRLGRQHEALGEGGLRQHGPADAAQQVGKVDHHEVVVELTARGGRLARGVEVGDAEVHPLLGGWHPEEGLLPEHIAVARGRCHVVASEEEHLAKHRHVECRPEFLLLAGDTPTCGRPGSGEAHRLVLEVRRQPLLNVGKFRLRISEGCHLHEVCIEPAHGVLRDRLLMEGRAELRLPKLHRLDGRLFEGGGGRRAADAVDLARRGPAGSKGSDQRKQAYEAGTHHAPRRCSARLVVVQGLVTVTPCLGGNHS